MTIWIESLRLDHDAGTPDLRLQEKRLITMLDRVLR